MAIDAGYSAVQIELVLVLSEAVLVIAIGRHPDFKAWLEGAITSTSTKDRTYAKVEPRWVHGLRPWV